MSSGRPRKLIVAIFPAKKLLQALRTPFLGGLMIKSQRDRFVRPRPRHRPGIHARGCDSLQGHIALPEEINREMVHQTGKAKSLILPCCFPYSVKSAQCLPLHLRASRSRSLQKFPLVSGLPSGASAAVSASALFDPFFGTMPLSDFSIAYISGLRPQAFPVRSDSSFPTRGYGDLLVLEHRVSTHAQGLRLRGTCGGLAGYRPPPVLHSPSDHWVGIPDG
jgi:hypothetical protein